MKKFGDFICEHVKFVFIVSLILLLLSFIGIKLTKINYDILVYLPEDIETIKGQNILTDDFNLGAFSITVIENMSSKDILKLEQKISEVEGVNRVISGYDLIGTTLPLEMFPNELINKIHKNESDLVLITFNDSISSDETLSAVREIKEITNSSCKIGGMSAMVLDTMDLSEKEIAIYVIIAVALCLLVLELSIDSYLVPLLLLANIGIAILFNLGSNFILGDISYITKALVAILQLGVTTDFSIFLYHSYENKKTKYKDKKQAMSKAINETFQSVIGSSLTTIAGFLVLCTMRLTLGTDLGIVMAKGVFIGVICVVTLFPSLLLLFDKYIEKTKHKTLTIKFDKLNNFVISHYKTIFIIFVCLLIPTYLAYSKVDVYYKIDESLPKNLDSIVANSILSERFNITSPEIIILDRKIKPKQVNEMIKKIETVEGIDFVLSYSKIKELGITEDMLPTSITSIFESDKYQMLLLNSNYGIASKELNNQVEEINNIIKSYDKKSILAGEGPLMKDLVTISDNDFKNVNTSSIICILVIMLIVLKSISLPFLLIIAIEFAIFTNMGIAYFSGVILPFIAPIVLGTIQLGATIDYAILMTTTYIDKRKKGISKKKAMLETTSYCSNSIFVSGMCFFAATFGVGVYSELEMVGALCTLISRGAIISMIAVIMILPSILLIFDDAICITTYKMKGKRNMNKKRPKQIASLIILSLCLSSTSVMALTKNETVYGKLNSDGSIKSILVNEHLLNNKNQDTIEDFSDLQDILNINGDNSFTKNNDKLIWDAHGENIFYQGTTNKELPVKVEISYKLDGKAIKIDDLLGKSGKVDIILKYTNSDKKLVKVNGEMEALYTPFVVTMGTVIPSDNNDNIQVTNGKIVNNGTGNIIIGIATPGLYESLKINELKDLNKITISYDTKNFSLSSIYSVVTPKILESSDLKVFDELSEITSNLNLLQTSINQIEVGAKTLLDGSSSLKNGTSQIHTNLIMVSEKLKEIEKGQITLATGLKEITSKLEEAKSNLSLTSNVNEINQIKYLIEQNQNTINGLKVDEVTNAHLIKLLEENKRALETTLQNLSASNTTLNNLIDSLIKNLKYMEQGVSTLTNGTTRLQEASTILASKSKELDVGASKVYVGMENLSNGIVKINKEGISKMTSITTGSLSNMPNKLKALVKLGENYETFTMKSSKDDGITKFILVVDSKKEEKKELKVIQKEEKVTLWNRITNLFK